MKLTLNQQLHQALKQIVLAQDKLAFWFFMDEDEKGSGERHLKLVRDEGSEVGVSLVSGFDCQVSKLSVQGLDIGKIGEGYAKILESSALSISRAYAAIWKKEAIDLTELARKRWIDKWTMDRLAVHFGCGRTAVVRHIGRLKANPDLIENGVARSRAKSRRHRFMG